MNASNLAKTIDAFGVLKAEIAALAEREKQLKAALADLAPGAYEGDLFRLTISESVRESADGDLKAATEELVEKYLSRQFITAHTNKTDVRTLRCVARTGKAIAA